MTESSFNVPGPDAFIPKGDLPRYSEPRQLGFYSTDEDRRVFLDASGLRYYYVPQVPSKEKPVDIFEGFVNFKARPELNEERLDHLLKAILMITEQRFQAKEPILQGNRLWFEKEKQLITWRGIMTKLLCVPYESSEGWRFDVVRFRGVIYVSERMTDEKLNRVNRRSIREKKLIYGGYKFEQLFTLSRPPPPRGEPVTQEELILRRQEAINNSESFASVFESKLGDISLLLAAEIDCLYDASDSISTKNYLEFKTTRVLKTDDDRNFFEKNRLIKYWAQSYLANIPRILCGYRNETGHVIKLEMFETLKIPRTVRKNSHSWDGNICLNFAEHFLSWLDQAISNQDDLSVVWSLSFSAPYTQIVLKQEPQSTSFLPNWYISEINRFTELHSSQIAI